MRVNVGGSTKRWVSSPSDTIFNWPPVIELPGLGMRDTYAAFIDLIRRRANPRTRALFDHPLKSSGFLEYLYGCGEKKFPPHFNFHSFPRIPMQLNIKLAVIAAAVALAACGKKEEAAAPVEAPAAAPAADAQVIKIGHVGPTSGAIAHLGKDNENGAKMAIEELNDAGLTIGGAPTKFELLAEDDAADPKQGTAAAQKLVDAKVAGVIGHLNSGTTIPASQIYNDAGIPQISPSASTPWRRSRPRPLP